MNMYRSAKHHVVKSNSKTKQRKKQLTPSNKNLNPDYYINLQRKKTKKPKLDMIYSNSSSKKKLKLLTQGETQEEEFCFKTKYPIAQVYTLGSSRTRSSTVLNEWRKQGHWKLSRKSEMDRLYLKAKQTLKRYQQQIGKLQKKNFQLQQQNLRLKERSLTHHQVQKQQIL